MKNLLKSLAIMLATALLIFAAACGGGGSSSGSDQNITAYAGTMPIGDYVEILINRTASQVRRINHTTSEDSGWWDYTDVAATDALAQGFSILKKVDLSGGGYVLFAEFPNTAVVYQGFNAAGNPTTLPLYAVYREAVDASEYYENAYNWMHFKIVSVADEVEMSAGFCAFDDNSTEGQGLLYGAGFDFEDTDPIEKINETGTVKVNDFTSVPELVANIIWLGTVGDMDEAAVLMGTTSGTNILDFGPGPSSGGGSALMIPQSDVSLADAAGTYLLIVYQVNKSADTGSVTCIKLVVSETSPHLRTYLYNQRTDAIPGYLDDAVTMASITPAESPGGLVAVCEQLQDISDIEDAHSSSIEVQNSYLCPGAYVAIDDVNDRVVYIMFDPTGSFCGFIMSDTGGSNEIYRFGFGIKDPGYTNI